MTITLNKPEFLTILFIIPVIWFFLYRYGTGSITRTQLFITAFIRSLLIGILVLTLSDPQFGIHSDDVQVMYCLDRSDSVKGQDKAIQFIADSSRKMGPEDKAGLIVFAKEASVETSLTSNFSINGIKSETDNQHTNIYDALQVATGRFTGSGTKRIVLFSDGNQTIGQAEDMATLASSLGIEIWGSPLETWFQDNEIFMNSFHVPEHVQLDTPFHIKLVITSTEETTGDLLIQKNRSLFKSRHVTLKPGKNNFEFTDTHEKSGLYLYKAIINPETDTVYANNEIMAFSEGTQRSKILYVADLNRSEKHLFQALKVQGYDIDLISPSEFPDSIHMLINYNAVILDNVSAGNMPVSSMIHMEKYVRDTGGGLLVTGGPNSLGAGFYLNSPIEKALPVFMDRPTQAEIPSLCLILVIDKSSSMSGYIQNNIKLEGAKIASFSAVELLKPNDKIGILAFDMEYQWIVSLQNADNRELVARELSMLKADGGTDLYPGLLEAYKQMKQTDASKKHIIVLSDGLTDTADFKSLLSDMTRENISLSTVAVGEGSDITLMRNMAHWGSGRYYYTDDADNIPRIFTGETQIVSNNVIIEKKIEAQVSAYSDILGGIPTNKLPDISGMIATYPKPASHTIINTIEGPLLAIWKYGLGQAAVFTSDLNSRWSSKWVNWEYYEKFTSQMIKSIQKKSTDSITDITVHKEGENAMVYADILNQEGIFVNQLNLEMKVLPPSKKDITVNMKQTAPGRYQAYFPAAEEGEYYISLYAQEKNRFTGTHTFGYSIPYPDEYKTRFVNMALLTKLTEITGGLMIDSSGSSEQHGVKEKLFTAGENQNMSGRKLWPHLIILFLIVFITDIAVRKFIRITAGSL